jgi:serine/threonine-protein kinase
MYSMGCLMYEALAGSPPFSGATYMEIAHKHCTQMPASLLRIRSDIKNGRAIENVILKAMAKEPDKRFSTMLELKQALEQAGKEASTGWLSKAKALWMWRRD